MAYKKRWEIPFESLNGTSCRIDILKNGYTGDTYDVISNGNLGWPADDPFYYEEDDSDNLFDVIRTKTGYIRLVENNHGDLSSLYPLTDTDHYVRFYYGDVLSFTGYIKAESFGNDWGALHREINLPVMSPLSLADNMWFTQPSTPEYRVLGKWLYEAINGLDENIADVEFPDPLINSSPTSNCLMRSYLCSLVLCPQEYEWGNKTNMSSASDFYGAKSYKYLLSGICNEFGLILHDEPNKLVFSRFDYAGAYSRMAKANLRDGTNQRYYISSGDISDVVDAKVSSDDNEESRVLPYSRITIKGDGKYWSQSDLPTEISIRNTNGGTYNGTMYGYYYPLNDVLKMYNLGPHMHVTGRLSASGSMLAYDGSAKILSQKDAGETGIRTLVSFLLYNNRTGSMTFKANFGDRIDNLNNPGTTPTIHVYIKRNGQYWTQDTGWTSSEVSTNKAFSGEQSLTLPGSNYYQPIEIKLTSDIQYWSEYYIYVIESLKLGDDITSLGEWAYGSPKAEMVIEGNPSEMEGSVTREFSYRWFTSNHLQHANASSIPDEPLYPYLLVSQSRLILTCKGALPDNHYMERLSFDGVLWKLIAKKFHPWNDEYNLVLHTTDRKNYMYFRCYESNTTFTFTKAVGAGGNLYFSTDKENWTEIESGVAIGEFYYNSIVYFRGNLTPGQNGIGIFSSTGSSYGRFDVGGDLLSLYGMDSFAVSLSDYACKNMFHNSNVIKASDLLLPIRLAAHCYEEMFSGCTRMTATPRLVATTLAVSCYASMFSGCSSLVNAPLLSAVTLVESCYEGMFSGCTLLDTPPSLPASTLAVSCYKSMFSGCTSLGSSPNLLSMTLAESCYESMFSGCTSLTYAGLQAPKLASRCYASMFSGCSSLDYVKCLAIDISATDCTANWLYGVASDGIFEKDSNMSSWPTGNSGIPSGWEIINNE